MLNQSGRDRGRARVCQSNCINDRLPCITVGLEKKDLSYWSALVDNNKIPTGIVKANEGFEDESCHKKTC